MRFASSKVIFTTPGSDKDKHVICAVLIATWWWLLPSKFTLQRCLFLHISSISVGLLSKSEEFKLSHQLHPSSKVDHHKTPLFTSYHSKIHGGNPKICELSGLPWKNLVPRWTVGSCWAQAIDVLMILVIAKQIFQICLRFYCWWPSNPIIMERIHIYIYILLGTHTSPPKDFPFPEVRYYVGSLRVYPGQIWKNYFQLLVIPRPAPAPPHQKKLVVAEAPQFCSFFVRKSFSNFAFLGSFGKKQGDSKFGPTYKEDLEIILHQAENSWNQVIPKILQCPCSLLNFRNFYPWLH